MFHDKFSHIDTHRLIKATGENDVVIPLSLSQICTLIDDNTEAKTFRRQQLVDVLLRHIDQNWDELQWLGTKVDE